ncbi:ATP-binding protein [Streptomyces sp. NPDC002516]
MPSGAGLVLPSTAGEARARVQALLTTALRSRRERPVDEVLLADVLLVTSELVTNAIRHGGGLTGFDAVLTDAGLLLRVADASADPPVATEPAKRGADGAGGFGWPLICRLAGHVAITPRPDGKQITALISLD